MSYITYHILLCCYDNFLYLYPGSLICPKVVKSVHYCPATKKTIERKYTDLTSLEPFPSSGAYPTKVSSCKMYSRKFLLNKTIFVQFFAGLNFCALAKKELINFVDSIFADFSLSKNLIQKTCNMYTVFPAIQ